MNITERGPNTVKISLGANELVSIVNALEVSARGAEGDDADNQRRVQRPLVEALRMLRPKAHLSESTGRWITDWPRSDDGKHV